MLVYNREQVRAVESNAARSGITPDRLMENAGSAVAKAIRDRVSVEGKRVCVLCGKGNNGGDGFVVARKLFQSGAAVTVVLVCGAPATDTARTAFEYARGLGVKVVAFDSDFAAAREAIGSAEVIVDAVLGIGFRGELNDNLRAVCRLANASSAIIFAVDVPTGVDSDSACADRDCILADCTVTFFKMKACHVMYPALKFCGEVILADIGTPESAFVPSSVGTLGDGYYAKALPAREPDGHKGTFGKVGFVCGSYGMLGAEKIALTAAMRSGIGLAVAAVGERAYPILAAGLNEPVFKIYGELDGAIAAENAADICSEFSSCRSALIGCGLGHTDNTRDLVQRIVSGLKIPLVIDADGINCVADNIDILSHAAAGVILTPHCGEMARLCGVSVDEILRDRMKYGRLICDRYRAIVVLKSASTLVFAPDGRTFIFTGGNSGMATAGSGDMLAGIIAALVCRCPSLLDAALAGVYVHFQCGAAAAEKQSQCSMTVPDMLGCMGEVYRKFE